MYSLPKLNERNVYVNLFALIIALSAATLHIACDVDRLVFNFGDVNLHAQERITRQLHPLAQRALILSTAFTTLFPFLYLFLRRPVISFVRPLIQKFYTIHHADYYSGFPVSLGILFHTFLAAFFLSFIWLFANMAFGVYMSLPPTHRGELLSAKSEDKNGTLINGLQETKHKPLIRMLAFYELLYIAFNKQDRRTSIFSDIERKQPIWISIKTECLKQLTDITTQIQPKTNDIKAAKPTIKESKPTSTAGVIPIKSDYVFAKKSDTHIIDGMQDPDATASTEVLTVVANIHEKLQKSTNKYSSWAETLLDSDVGYPLRFTVERRARKLVPNPTLTSMSVLALAQLVCHSLDEDQYGTVQKDVPMILQTLYEAMVALQNFIDNPPVHWSNNKEKQKITQSKDALASKEPFELKHIRDVMQAIDEGFTLIVDEFWKYLPCLQLSGEVRTKIGEYYGSVEMWTIDDE